MHPFHVSVAEMEYNSKSQCLEVALRVWPEDLEKALTQQAKNKVDLDTTKNIDTLIFDYLNKKIKIQNPAGKTCKLTWIGKELGIKQAWLYFEVKTGLSPADFSFSNRLFFELQEDQINLFNLNFGNRRASISFAKDKAVHRLSPKDFVPIHNPFARTKN
ncbi:MAG: DUF6702 family protein [Planctomycetota bacterium]|nr:DUF6702 family protein [Planctomycetota bacterium]